MGEIKGFAVRGGDVTPQQLLALAMGESPKLDQVVVIVKYKGDDTSIGVAHSTARPIELVGMIEFAKKQILDACEE